MNTSRKTLLCTVGAVVSVATTVLGLASAAQAQPAWSPDAYQRPKRLAPQPVTEPTGPGFSWDPLRFGLALETQTTWLQDGAARRLVGKGVPTALGLSLHVEALRPTHKLTAKLDLGWVTSSTSAAQPMGPNTESFDTNMVTLGASMRYQLFRWLAPYARLAGGVGWDKLSVGSGSGNLHDEHTFGHAAAGAGVFLRSPAVCLRPSPASYCAALMGHIEGGYLVGSSSTWSLRSSPASGVPDPVPTESVAVGEMARRAPYLRLSLGIAL